MSSVTHIQRYRRPLDLVSKTPLSPDGRLRELWSDTVATIALVSLAAVLLFEALRIIMR